MIIYQIFNKKNRKSYIGQSTRKFHERYRSKNWFKYIENQYLKASIKKYGNENFAVIILKEGVESIDELNRLEEFYIREYNSVYPNGYNFKLGGNNKIHHELTKEKMRQTGVRLRGKEYKLKNHHTGEVVEFNNLAEFSKTYKLSRTNLVHMIKGYENKSGGKKYRKRVGVWTLPETTLQSWTVKSPTGEIHKILEGELRGFCREHNLHKNGIICLFKADKSKIHSYLGWTAVK